jgi:hypothetical protein
MAIIYSYPKATIQLVDYLIGTKKGESGNPTKSFLISDLVDLINNSAGNVPYVGATENVNLGSNDIYTTGGARLYDDGTVQGSTFQFTGNGSYITSAATTNRVWTLPNATGVLALQTAANGSFTSANGKTITVVNGIITSIV